MRESHKENVTRLVTMVRKTDADRGGDDGDEENNDVSDSGRAASQSRSKVALYIQIVLIDIMSMYSFTRRTTCRNLQYAENK